MAYTGYCESVSYTFCNLLTLGVSAGMHILLVWMFVGKMHMGWEGILIASGLHFVVRWVISFAYTNLFVKPYYETKGVDFFDKETIQNLWPQAQRGFGSLVMGCWSWWAFDIFTLIACYLEPEEIISAQTIMRSLGLLTFMIPVGFTKAAGFFVGKFIGSDCETSIKHYYNVSMGLAIIVGFIQIIALVIFKD